MASEVDGPERRKRGRRLDTWNEIATYIDRSVRTAHRWHSQLGLPVHRMRGEKGTIVYAYSDEIDRWLKEREIDEGPDAGDPSGTPSWLEPVVPLVRRLRKRWLLAWASAATMAAGLGWFGLILVFLSGSGASGTRAFGAVESDLPYFAEPRGIVAFHRYHDGQADLFLVQDDGQGERRITDHPAVDTRPAISPDGQEIAFISTRWNDTYQLFVMDLSGTDVRQLTFDPDHMHVNGVDWHPGGERLVFSAKIKGTFQLYEIGADGAGLRQLTFDGDDSREPRYSLDGETILYTGNTAFNGFTNEIYEKVDDSSSRRLTFTGANHGGAEVLLDGIPVIAFSKRMLPAKDSQLYFLLPGGEERPIYPEYNHASEGGAIGPDGPGASLIRDEIVFLSTRAGDGGNLWRMYLDGSRARQLTTEGASSPDWWVPRSGDDHPDL